MQNTDKGNLFSTKFKESVYLLTKVLCSAHQMYWLLAADRRLESQRQSSVQSYSDKDRKLVEGEREPSVQVAAI
jgi:hypothetical protein